MPLIKYKAASWSLSREEVLARFYDKILIGDECWEWIAGSKSVGGYGRLTIERQSYFAHRVMYELMVGPIPDGLQLDHLCRNPPCVRPDHLEPVSARENVLRSDGPAALNAMKTHCPQGHLYDEANTYVKSNGGRVCRECERVRNRAWYALNPQPKRERIRWVATHCPAGHPYDAANTYVHGGKRYCKPCNAERRRRRDNARSLRCPS